MHALKALLSRPGRAAALWLGSLALPFFHVVILYSVSRGPHVSIGVGTVLVIYLGMPSVTAALPSPGAIGALELALAAGLTAAGASSAMAVDSMGCQIKESRGRATTVPLPRSPFAVWAPGTGFGYG